VNEADSFARAFIAAGYLMGLRGASLVEPLTNAPPSADALLRRLENPEREQRARAIAPAIAELASSVQKRTLL
jgi:hypothetical protein